MEIGQVCLLAMMGVLLGVFLKAQKAEYGILMGIVLCLVIFSYVFRYFEAVKDQLLMLQGYLEGKGQYLFILCKVVGITYLSELCASLCRDAGFGAVAGQIELAGKVTVLFAGLPILLAVVETIASFMV